MSEEREPLPPEAAEYVEATRAKIEARVKSAMARAVPFPAPIRVLGFDGVLALSRPLKADR